MQYIRQGATQIIMFGPFVDKTDGVTLKTDATTITDIDHATTGIFLSKNGAAAAVRHQAVTASVADAYGMMKVTLDATDTGTVGTLDVLFAKAATYLPVHKSFQVIDTVAYDALYADAATGAFTGVSLAADQAVNATKINGVATTSVTTIGAVIGTATAGALEATAQSILADTGELQTNQGNWITATGFATPTNITAGTITTVTNLTNLPAAAALEATSQAILADGPQRITKNTALASFPFFMVDSTDHVTGATGLTVTATRSLDGAAFGACANAVTEVSGGWYKISFDAADLNANTVAVKFTATGADPVAMTIVTEPT